MFKVEFIYGTFKKDFFRNIFRKYFQEISFQTCFFGIVGTSLANIAKMAFPKGNKQEEICKKNVFFLSGFSFMDIDNSQDSRGREGIQNSKIILYAILYAKTQTFVEP